LHYQIGKYAQSKLIRVVNGQILDVVIDLRPQSKSYGMYCSLILSELNKKQLFIPKGFAHGFLALEDDTIVNYKCDNYYNKNAEAGIVYNDKTLNINWGKHDFDFLLSEKDKHHPTFENARF
jgi:dTDP-4-dehydrorhamnose 3,5-epimerase (EC 5.1.3.13)